MNHPNDSAPKMQGYHDDLAWTRVTPDGVQRKRKSYAELKEDFRKTVSQIKSILAFEKKRVGFGSVLGNTWLFLDPVLHTALYYFIVVVISGSTNTDRLLKIAIAVMAWRVHTKMISQASSLFANKIGQLSQIYYPLQLILFEFLFVNMMLFTYSIAGPLLILLANGIYPSITWIWFLVIFLVQVTFTMSLAVLISVVGAFVKDLQNILFFPMAVWWYASPAIYDLSTVPERYQKILSLNPFSPIFEAYFAAIIRQQTPELGPLVVVFLVSLILLIIGLRWLARARYYFYKYL